MITLRYAWRSLCRSPGFVVMAVLALAFGLGLSTTMFAVIDAVVNPYIAYDEPDRVIGIRWFYRAPLLESASDPELYAALRNHGHAFEAIAAFRFETMALRAGAENREIGIARVEPGYFQLMRVRPVLGRAFTPGDGADVVVLSQAVWRRVFGMRARLDGASVFLGAQAYHVIGVLPRGADYPNGALAWIPFPPEDQLHGRFDAVARLRTGVTEATAFDQLHTLGAILTSRYAPAARAPVAFINMGGVRSRSERLREIHFAMVGSAIIVLLIACANLAHLVLARGMARQGELALRMALGASRASVVGQMFLECAAITLAGAALGALIALWGTDVLANQMPQEISWVGLVRPRLSWRVFGWSAYAAAVAATLFGLVPAVRVAMRVDMNDPLKDAAATTTARVRHRYNVLVIAEVALALVLLMSGGLLVRTVRTLARQADYGFDTRTLWRADVGISTGWRARLKAHGSYVDTITPRLRVDALAAARNVPGVLGAAFEGTGAPPGASVSGEMTATGGVITMRTYPVVSGTYLQTLGLPAVSGRLFQPGDGEGSMVAVIDPVAASILYPGRNPVGRMLKLGSPASGAGWVPIIGVARNPRVLTGRDEPPAPYVWIAAPAGAIRGSIVFRTEGPDARAVVEMRRRLSELPGVRVTAINTFTYARDAALASRRFFAGVFVLMGAVSLVLSALGLYGVLAYAVGQRMREFALRIALGAEAARLYRMVLHDAVVMLLAGIGIGAIAAMVATKYIDRVLQGVYRTDAVSLILAELALLVVGMAAALVPARRAVKADPLQILRAV